MSDPISIGAAGFSILDFVYRISSKILKVLKLNRNKIFIDSKGNYISNKNKARKILRRCLLRSKELEKLEIICLQKRKELSQIKLFYREIVQKEIKQHEENITKGIKILFSNEVKQMYSFYIGLTENIMNVVQDIFLKTNKELIEFNYKQFSRLDVFQVIDNFELNVVVDIDNSKIEKLLRDRNANINNLSIPGFLEFSELLKYITIEDFIAQLFSSMILNSEVDDIVEENYGKLLSMYNWNVGLH